MMAETCMRTRYVKETGTFEISQQWKEEDLAQNRRREEITRTETPMNDINEDLKFTTEVKEEFENKTAYYQII